MAMETDNVTDFEDIQELVKQSEIFVFVLTEGVLNSLWSVEQLRYAVESNKEIIIVKGMQSNESTLAFQLPSAWPTSITQGIG
jgi:hypothetical protein